MEQSQDKPPPGKKAYDLGHFRILIVEDSQFISNLLSSCLSEMGVKKVLQAADNREAKDKVLTYNAMSSPQNIDIVLLDWLMPDGKGSELLQWMRKHKSPTIKFLPVVVCSAYTSTDIVFESRDAGTNEILVKPVSADKIAKRILYVIDHPRPYVQSPNFIGPDRRRKSVPYEGEERRVNKPEVISES